MNRRAQNVLTFAAIAEAVTGVALVVAPALVCRLLLGTEATGIAAVVARVTGIALIALGVACWPGATALRGMFTYSALATVYLGYIAVGGDWGGPLLWPAVVVHALLTLLLAWESFRRNTPGDGTQGL